MFNFHCSLLTLSDTKLNLVVLRVCVKLADVHLQLDYAVICHTIKRYHITTFESKEMEMKQYLGP